MLCCLSAMGQQAAQHSLNQIDPYNLNPAYGGFDRSLSINFNYRTQWTGIESNPAHFYINAHLPVYLLKGGAGISLRRDRAGVIRSTEFNFSYNRVFSLGRQTFSIGLRTGLRQYSIDNQSITTPDGIYTGGIFSHEDLILGEDNTSGVLPTWTLGGFYRSDYVTLGVTLSDFAPNTFVSDGVRFANGQFFSLFATSDIIFESIKVSPSILVKSNLDFTQINVGAILKSGNIFGGVSLRGINANTFDSFIFLTGIKLNPRYTVTYSYDMGLSSVRNVSQGSHEIHINYNLNKLIGIGLDPEIIYNPRNL